MDDEFKRQQGETSILRGMLQERLLALSEEEREILRNSTAGTVADLRQRWGDRLTPFQEGMVDALERIEFVLRHRKKFLHSAKPASDKPYLLCRKCEIPIIIENLAEAVCPQCGTNFWLELVLA